MALSPYEENILTFVCVIKNQPELFTVENGTELLELLAKLPDDVEEISNEIALWYETHPQILGAILEVPVEDLDSVRGPNGTKPSLTGQETKSIIGNEVRQNITEKQSPPKTDKDK
jgi:hypothetical protein